MLNIFANIPSKNIPRLLTFLEAHTFTFSKGSKILSNIIEDNAICIVKSGIVQMNKIDYQGNTIITEELGENSLFGSFLEDFTSKGHEFKVIEDLELIIIDFNKILNADETLSTTYHQFIKNIISIMTLKIKEQNERLEILSNKTIRNKLLAYFKMIHEKTKSMIIYLPFSYTNLANYLAMDRTAMARELKNLKDEGLILTKGRMIKILYDIN